MANRVFYESNKKIDVQRTMDNVQSEYKGTTRDNYKIYHWTYYDTQRGKHISYDTVEIKGEHEYIMGSGHEVDHSTHSTSRWDYGNEVTWRQAIERNLRDLVKGY